METVKNPKTKLLDEGEKLRVKQIETLSGQLLPKHKASEESALIVIEDACDFKAIHVTPKNIRFEFAK